MEFAYNNSKHTSTGYSLFMLMYGFQLRVAIDVNIHDDELQRTQNFLRDMQYMLHIARDNIKTPQNRAHFYANNHKQPPVFKFGQKGFLCVPLNSKTFQNTIKTKFLNFSLQEWNLLKRSML